jgi:hypothetical protein
MLKEWEVRTLFEEYERLYLFMQEEQAELDRLKGEIKAHVLEVGDTVSHGAVVAQYRSGYKRVSWDSKRLDGYAAANPEILAFRKESEVSPTVSISVKAR